MMPTRVVLTGGPSAGKTTLLELLKKEFGGRVAVAPEAATMLFRGGFVRPVTDADALHTQRAIYTLQRELEARALDQADSDVPLFCDRGTVDGCAYWPGNTKEFFLAMGTNQDREFERYTAVIHLQAAAEGMGYSTTEVRTETAAEAAALDRRIGEAWGRHPRYVFIPNQLTFLEKINLALKTLSVFLPVRSAGQPGLRIFSSF